jgi:tellurite resistance protein TerC
MAPERLVLWIAFNVFVLGMLAIDLGIFHRKAHTVSIKEASIWSAVWILLALVFNLGIYFVWGQDKALEFLTGYVIEKSLSVDNLFVFLMIFQYFATPAIYQHRILFWYRDEALGFPRDQFQGFQFVCVERGRVENLTM